MAKEQKTIKGTFIPKHDSESNWIKVGDTYIPNKGEIIIYNGHEDDSQATIDYPTRIKIGDGETVLNKLPFSTSEVPNYSDFGDGYNRLVFGSSERDGYPFFREMGYYSITGEVAPDGSYTKKYYALATEDEVEENYIAKNSKKGTPDSSISIGANKGLASVPSNNSIAIGANATIETSNQGADNSIALGYWSVAKGSGAIQIGHGTNDEPYTVNFGGNTPVNKATIRTNSGKKALATEDYVKDSNPIIEKNKTLEFKKEGVSDIYYNKRNYKLLADEQWLLDKGICEIENSQYKVVKQGNFELLYLSADQKQAPILIEAIVSEEYEGEYYPSVPYLTMNNYAGRGLHNFSKGIHSVEYKIDGEGTLQLIVPMYAINSTIFTSFKIYTADTEVKTRIVDEDDIEATRSWVKETYSPVVKISITLDLYRNPSEASVPWNLDTFQRDEFSTKFYIIPLTEELKEALNNASIFTYSLTHTGYLRIKGAHFNYINLNSGPDDSAGDVYYTQNEGLCIRAALVDSYDSPNALVLNIAAI